LRGDLVLVGPAVRHLPDARHGCAVDHGAWTGAVARPPGDRPRLAAGAAFRPAGTAVRAGTGRMTGDVRKVVELTRGVRACFNRLRALGDTLHEDLGITASMRSVLESLHEDGARTVPQIAKSKSVTRQHIQ